MFSLLNSRDNDRKLFHSHSGRMYIIVTMRYFGAISCRHLFGESVTKPEDFFLFFVEFSADCSSNRSQSYWLRVNKLSS